MEHVDLFLSREDALLIEQCLETFIDSTAATAVMLVGRDGNLVAQYGTFAESDPDSLCAISAGAFATSESLAGIAGETTFSAIAHQGKRANLYVTAAGDANLLLILYDRHTSNAVVRLQARVTAEAIIHTLEGVYAREKKNRNDTRMTLLHIPIASQPESQFGD